MADKQYLNAFMNNSATIRDVLAADVTDAPHKAVTYDAEGKPAANDGGVSKAGTEVDVLIKDIGLALAGGAIKKGEHLTATTTGAVQKAAAGNFILGIAMTATTAAGELVPIQMTKSGYEKAASGGN